MRGVTGVLPYFRFPRHLALCSMESLATPQNCSNQKARSTREGNIVTVLNMT
jgi:hypothetical protein